MHVTIIGWWSFSTKDIIGLWIKLSEAQLKHNFWFGIIGGACNHGGTKALPQLKGRYVSRSATVIDFCLNNWGDFLQVNFR